MAKTEQQMRDEAIERAHQITASQGGTFAGSPWTPKHDKPVPTSKK